MKEKSLKDYLILFAFLNVFIVIGAWFLAQYVFITWQGIPDKYFSWNTLLLYSEKYGHVAKVKQAIKISWLVGFIAIVASNIFVLVALFMKPKRELHGSARFATDAEIKATGLLPTDKQRKEESSKKPSAPSLLVGKYKGKFLEFFGNQFMFIAAPTRSGKGVGIVIPNLLHYPDSCVVLDIKNENWDITAGFRSQYQDVFLFCPKAEDNRSHCYNPLDYIDRRHSKRMADIQNIANLVYPSDDPQSAFWQDNAQRIFNGLVLYMIETPSRPCTMSELTLLLTPKVPLKDWIEDTIHKRTVEEIDYIEYYKSKEEAQLAYEKKEQIKSSTDDDEIAKLKYEIERLQVDIALISGQEKKGTYVEVWTKGVRPLTSECIQELLAFAGIDADNTRSGVLSTAKAPLAIFSDPQVACATSRSDFRLDEVRKKRMTIYVGIQPNELARFEKLLNLFFSQLINLNTRVLPEQDESLKYQCLVLLDEFTALGRVDIINKAVAYIAGYNMRLMLIFQNKSQCEQYYTREGTQTMLSNMACQVAFTPRTIDDAKSYSETLGTETIKSRSTSRTAGKGGRTVSISDQSRALLMPQELMEMDNKKEIVIFQGSKPIMADKIRYYEEKVFEDRQRLEIKAEHIPAELDVIHQLKIQRGYKFKNPQSKEEWAKLRKQSNYKQYEQDLFSFFGIEDLLNPQTEDDEEDYINLNEQSAESLSELYQDDLDEIIAEVLGEDE